MSLTKRSRRGKRKSTSSQQTDDSENSSVISRSSLSRSSTIQKVAISAKQSLEVTKQLIDVGIAEICFGRRLLHENYFTR